MFADTFRFYHRSFGTCASILGFISNFLLLSLVVKSTHPVKQIFFQMTFVDITFLTLTAINDPLVIFDHGNEFVLQNGFFRHLPQPINGIMMDLWVFGVYLSICSICVQFIFRYLILCKGYVLSIFHMCLLMSVPFALAVATGYLYHAGFVLGPGDAEFATQMLKDLLVESGETSVHVASVSRKDNILLKTIGVVAFTEIVVCYLIIAFCVYKIQKRLKILYPILSDAKKRIQRQISYTLFVQAITPLCVSVIPLGYLAFIILSGGTAFWSMIVLTMGFSWVPFTNAMLTMVIVREFRPTFFSNFQINGRIGWFGLFPTETIVGANKNNTGKNQDNRNPSIYII